MQNKVLWVDLETTGTNPIRNGIVQLAALVDIDNHLEAELNLKMAPLAKAEIDPEALAVNEVTEEEIRGYPHQSDQYATFVALLSQYINRYEKLDKFILAGYNINAFDEPFLRQLFMDNAATRRDRKYGGYFGSWFFWPKRDVQVYLAEHIAEHGLRLPNFKLATVCEHFGIPIDAHDALSDIQATRTLYRVLRYSIAA
jgi:DNA polymerase III epsilon subunit-like protein